MHRPAPPSWIVALERLGLRVIACHRTSSAVHDVAEDAVEALKHTRRGLIA